MQEANLAVESGPFLEFLATWHASLPSRPIAEALPDPRRTAIMSVDVINGFCSAGPLASPRVRAIIAPIVALLTRAWAHGVREIVLAQDAHDPGAIEFGQFPPHCVRGSSESETVPELRGLPFYPRLQVIPKNSINAFLSTALAEWMEVHRAIHTFLVVGDCTDLCTYQLAMHLRLEANARQLSRRVLVPADCVDTYDLSVQAARKLGGQPHDGPLFHDLFLYHMALNGIEVLAHVT